MSAKHALLGLLLHKPAYPYELADRLAARLGPAWRINSGQLSQTIHKMEQQGLIERVKGPKEGRRRQVFAITDSGAAEFERWFDDATNTSEAVFMSRRPLLAKITLAGPERLREALNQIDAYEAYWAERLAQLSAQWESAPSEGPQVRADHVLLRLSLSVDVYHLEAELAWARHAHEMVSWLLSRDAVWPSARERSGALSEQTRSRRAREQLFSRMAKGRPLR